MKFTGNVTNHKANDGKKYQRFLVELNTFEVETLLTLIYMFDNPTRAAFYKTGFELEGHMKGLRKDFQQLQKELQNPEMKPKLNTNNTPRQHNSISAQKDKVRGLLKALKIVEKQRPLVLTRKENGPFGPDPMGNRAKKIRNKLRQEIIDDINREVNLINNKNAKQ